MSTNPSDLPNWFNYPGGQHFDHMPWWQWIFTAQQPAGSPAPKWGSPEYWAWKVANEDWRQEQADRRARMIQKNITEAQLRYLRLIDAAYRGAYIEFRYILGRDLGKSIRIAQINLARANTSLWASIFQIVLEAYGFGTNIGAQSATVLVDYLVNNTRGLNADFWWRSIQATSQVGNQSAAAKRANDIRLSNLVYKNQQRSIKQVNRLITNGLKDGLTHKELSKLVLKHINPNVPGGPKYAARRLARTEINNAFHRTSNDLYKNQPWITAVKWNLSGSHPKGRSDACDTYAKSSHFSGGGRGVFRPGEVPGKPHPQCMCYVTPIVMDEAEFERKWGSPKSFARLWFEGSGYIPEGGRFL